LRDVLIRVEPHTAYALAHTFDLGRGGVKLFTRRPISAGDTVELIWADRDQPRTFCGRVVHVRSESDGLRAGVQFLKALSASTLTDLKKRPEEGTSNLRLTAGHDARARRIRTA
jgi:hypothetical protein